MKYTILRSLLATLLLFTFTSHAALYKGLDKDGNVIYSDKPFNNSKQFTPPALTVMDAPKVPPKTAEVTEEDAAKNKYTSFSIVAPKNNEVIWDNPQLIVELKVTPTLNITEGHRVWLFMDGKALVKNSQSLLLPIGKSDRGQHRLQAQIRDKKGKIIKRTKSVTVHIKNTVVPRAVPRAN